jgi:hypothetical protein
VFSKFKFIFKLEQLGQVFELALANNFITKPDEWELPDMQKYYSQVVRSCLDGCRAKAQSVARNKYLDTYCRRLPGYGGNWVACCCWVSLLTNPCSFGPTLLTDDVMADGCLWILRSYWKKSTMVMGRQRVTTLPLCTLPQEFCLLSMAVSPSLTSQYTT